MRIKTILLALALCAATLCCADTPAEHEVLMTTTMGDIRIRLYDSTPLHRDNFLKLVRSGFYDGLLFHRVIFRFMIQAGDSASRNAAPGAKLGDSPEAYQIPAEIRYPDIFHRRGSVAAAREGDDVNPERKSSMSQFYIVYGKRFDDDSLDSEQAKLDKRTNGTVKLTPEVREAYKRFGGTPHLDGQYTVFGYVVEGMDIVNSIQMVECDDNDRPLTDVRILKAVVVK